MQFFTKKVLIAARPKGYDKRPSAKDVTLRAAIDAAEPGIENTFKGQPAVEASIRDTLSEGYSYLGEPDLAIHQLKRVLALRRQVLGLDHSETLAAANNLASAYQDAGLYDEVLALLKDVLERTRSKLGLERGNASRHDQALERVPRLRPPQGGRGADRADAESHAKGARTRSSRHAVRDERPRADVSRRRPAARVVSLLEDVLQRRRATMGPDHRETIRSMHNLANVYRDSGRLADGIPLYEDVLARSEKKLGNEHVDTINAMTDLASEFTRTPAGSVRH